MPIYKQQTLELIISPLRLVLVFRLRGTAGIRLALLTGRNETEIGGGGDRVLTLLQMILGGGRF